MLLESLFGVVNAVHFLLSSVSTDMGIDWALHGNQRLDCLMSSRSSMLAMSSSNRSAMMAAFAQAILVTSPLYEKGLRRRIADVDASWT